MSNALSSDKAKASNLRPPDSSKEKGKTSHTSNHSNRIERLSHELPETSMKARSETTPSTLPSNSGLLDDPIVIGDSDDDSATVRSALVPPAHTSKAFSSSHPTLQHKRQTSNACSSLGSSSRSDLTKQKDNGSHLAKGVADIGGRPEAITSNMSRPRPDVLSSSPPAIRIQHNISQSRPSCDDGPDPVAAIVQSRTFKHLSQSTRYPDKGKQPGQDANEKMKSKGKEKESYLPKSIPSYSSLHKPPNDENKKRKVEHTETGSTSSFKPRESTGSTTAPVKSTVAPRILPAGEGSQARHRLSGLTARKTTSAHRPRDRQRASTSASTSSAQHVNPDPKRYLQALPAPKLPPKVKAPLPDWSRIPTQFRPLQGLERTGEFETSLQLTWLTEKKPDLSTPLGSLIFRENINYRQMWENPEIPQIEVIVPDNVKAKMVDPALAPPLEFVYTDRIVYRTDAHPIPPIWKCDCHGDCRNSLNCACREYQGTKIRELAKELDGDLDSQALAREFSGFAYESDRRPLHSHKKSPDNAETDSESRLVRKLFLETKLPIFECNAQCGCAPDCLNRTVGRGRREKLNLQKTLTKGWGVFVDQTVTHGRLVAHYSGELIPNAVQDTRSNDLYDRIGRTYIFSLDPWWIKTLGGGHELDEKGYLEIHGRRDSTKDDRPPNKSVSDAEEAEDQEAKDEPGVESLYAVDAFWFGNISRFINHSCGPNTTILPIYIDDNDHTKPIFAMFANKMIKNGHEVTTSYLDPTSVRREEDKTGGRNMTRGAECRCGARECSGVMFA